jgi:hypothetical protein
MLKPTVLASAARWLRSDAMTLEPSPLFPQGFTSGRSPNLGVPSPVAGGRRSIAAILLAVGKNWKRKLAGGWIAFT